MTPNSRLGDYPRARCDVVRPDGIHASADGASPDGVIEG